MNEALEMGRAVLSSQPFSQLVGAEITEVDGSRVVMELAIREQLKQHDGFIHGGVLAFLADIGLTFAGAMVLGKEVLTAEFKINYLRPGMGQRLISRSAVISASRTQAVVRCDVSMVNEGVEKICATALGTIAKRSAPTQT